MRARKVSARAWDGRSGAFHHMPAQCTESSMHVQVAQLISCAMHVRDDESSKVYTYLTTATVDLR